jgi:hypothetical protein
LGTEIRLRPALFSVQRFGYLQLCFGYRDSVTSSSVLGTEIRLRPALFWVQRLGYVQLCFGYRDSVTSTHLQQPQRKQVPLKRSHASNRLHVSQSKSQSFIYYDVPGNACMHMNIQSQFRYICNKITNLYLYLRGILKQPIHQGCVRFNSSSQPYIKPRNPTLPTGTVFLLLLSSRYLKAAPSVGYFCTRNATLKHASLFSLTSFQSRDAHIPGAKSPGRLYFLR